MFIVVWWLQIKTRFGHSLSYGPALSSLHFDYFIKPLQLDFGASRILKEHPYMKKNKIEQFFR